MTPFCYPSAQHVRRHGPRGYRDCSSFRPWLRDEFSFRCVYCLRREQWDRAAGLEIEHFLPIASFPAEALEYDNLLYACGRCNSAKSGRLTPDPIPVLLSEYVTLAVDGELQSEDSRARQLIEQLRLNSPEMIHFRRLWLEIIAMAERCSADLYRRIMGFPDNLPDLGTLRPPEGNDRPAGIHQSYYSQRIQGRLPEVY